MVSGLQGHEGQHRRCHAGRQHHRILATFKRAQGLFNLAIIRIIIARINKRILIAAVVIAHKGCGRVDRRDDRPGALVNPAQSLGNLCLEVKIFAHFLLLLWARKLLRQGALNSSITLNPQHFQGREINLRWWR